MIQILHKDFRLNGQKFNSVEELLTCVERLPNEVQDFLIDWFSNSKSIVVKTSGSTGSPKLISVKKKHMISSAKATGQFFNLHSQTSVLHCLPTQFVAGKMMWVRAFVLGWHIDLIEPSGSPLENIHKIYDFTAMTALQAANSLKKIEHINKLLIGGGSVSDSLRVDFNKVKTLVFLSYGMTETVSHVAIEPINQAAVNFFKDNNYHFKKDEFTLLPDVFISTDDRSCLVIDAKKITDKSLVTNDIVQITSINTFKWLGRIDHVINSGGIKLIPESIELKLSKFIHQPYFISSLPDDKLGDRLILFVEGKVNFDSMDLTSVLGKTELPKEIISIPHFTYTPTGKINRQITKAEYMEQKKSSPM
ncbi:AMP-binding protein [Namhaeicola litoreus]|uniref:AMP-binding protein n=1 Tax=Namhaeicola litoreus TaxID=1052145 RepID=A0ABW3Y503_9FLAO